MNALHLLWSETIWLGVEMRDVQGLRRHVSTFSELRVFLLLEVKKWRLFRSATFSPGFAGFEAYSVFLRIVHFTVTGYEARVDLVLIHFFLLYSVNHALLMQTDIL